MKIIPGIKKYLAVLVLPKLRTVLPQTEKYWVDRKYLHRIQELVAPPTEIWLDYEKSRHSYKIFGLP